MFRSYDHVQVEIYTSEIYMTGHGLDDRVVGVRVPVW
jgi:hypothetical protein